MKNQLTKILSLIKLLLFLNSLAIVITDDYRNNTITKHDFTV